MCIRDRASIHQLYMAIGRGDVPTTFTVPAMNIRAMNYNSCLLYTSDAADERSSVDLGGRRIIKKTNRIEEQLRMMS